MHPRFDSLGLLAREGAGGSRVVVSRFGGHVLSWVSGGRERLYLSGNAIADGRQPVRGGVPVCFPQFSGRGPLPKHGFARTRPWTEVPSTRPGTVHLRLSQDDETLGLWPHRFVLDLEVTLDADALVLQLEVGNTDAHPWSFSGALHTYLAVEDLDAARLLGLKGCRVEDTLRGTFSTVADDSPDLSQPIDSVYEGVTGPLELRETRASLRIGQEGFADAVVWNPGEPGAAKIADIGPGEGRKFLCVEAAQVRSPVTLAPGQSWSGRQVLRVTPPSSSSPR